MSNLSELREELTELRLRISILESVVLKIVGEINTEGIKDFPSDHQQIGEIRTPIGFKQKLTKKSHSQR